MNILRRLRGRIRLNSFTSDFVKLRERLKKEEIVLSDTYPGNPPKYKKKRAIGVFACFRRSFGLYCYEILRAKCVKGGRDIYIILHPTAQKEKDMEFHESLHERSSYFDTNGLVSFAIWEK